MSYKKINHVGRSDGECHAKILKVTKNKVALKAFDVNPDRIVDGIFIPDFTDMNCRMNRYEITAIGEEAKEKTGLEVGDIICADQLARYWDTFPVSVIKYDSIIFKFDKITDEILPLKDTVFVTPDKLQEEMSNGVLVLTDLLPIGTVTKTNIANSKKYNINVGDKVLLTNNCDNIRYKNNKFYIYKVNAVDAIIEGD